jgi:hypothetical protein
MKLVCNGCEQCASWPNKFNWAGIAESGDFTVFHKGNRKVSAQWTGGVVRVSLDGAPDRVIPAEDIVPTVRLYLNARKRRKILADAPVMFIRDV